MEELGVTNYEKEKEAIQAPSMLNEWLKSCTWVPFIVSMGLWIAYAQILPEHTTPNTSFLDSYNPRNRDDITYPAQSSSIDFGQMVLFFSCLWILAAGASEVLLPWKTTANKKTLLFRWLTLSLSFTEATFLTNATTDFIKYRVGALRPDFLNRCFGKKFNVDDLPSKLVNGIYSCPSGDIEEIKEGMVSFPSGHTSIGINMGLFITLYLIWCLYMRNRKSIVDSLTAKREFNGLFVQFLIQGLFFIALAPVLMGYGVAMTRLTDFRHHFVDVLMGMLLGTFFSVIVFFRTIYFLK